MFHEISQAIGDDPLLIQGSGGNTSYKKDNKMWIKASGKRLASAMSDDIFVQVDLTQIRNNIKKDVNDPLAQSVINKTNLRPSIETSLHALMPHKVVLHLHPVELLSWLVLQDGESVVNNFLYDFSFAWIPYVRPGVELTYAVSRALENKDADVLLLANHGLVVGADSCDQAIELMNNVLSRCRSVPRDFGISEDDCIYQMVLENNMRLPGYSVIHSLALDNISYHYCNTNTGVLYPDQAVFLGKQMHCYGESEVESSKSLFAIIKDVGVLVSKSANHDVDVMLRCHAEVLLRIAVNSKLKYLTDNEIESLIDWEPEKYRKRLSLCRS